MARVSASATLSPLRLSLLGPLRIERNGQPIHLPMRRVESLLAYLTLHPEPHAREELAALFWGDAPESRARNSFRVALATLNKILGSDLLLADRDRVQLNPHFPMWVDAREFVISNFVPQPAPAEAPEYGGPGRARDLRLAPRFRIGESDSQSAIRNLQSG